VQMPVVDGVMATQRIRELDGPAGAIPIIAMTANVLPEQVAKFRRAGMNGHVGKPFKREELYAAIEQVLNPNRPDRPADQPVHRPAPSLDASTFTGVRDMMGEAGVKRLLERLEGRLREALAGMPAHAEDRQSLAREAHALVSACGMLGFLPLSQMFRDLEAACLGGADLDPILNHAQGALESALDEIAVLRQAA
jgi:DNA-binding response OmpR family regulator